MHYYKDLALRELDSLPESPSKDAFIGPLIILYIEKNRFAYYCSECQQLT